MWNGSRNISKMLWSRISAGLAADGGGVVGFFLLKGQRAAMVPAMSVCLFAVLNLFIKKVFMRKTQKRQVS